MKKRQKRHRKLRKCERGIKTRSMYGHRYGRRSRHYKPPEWAHLLGGTLP